MTHSLDFSCGITISLSLFPVNGILMAFLFTYCFHLNQKTWRIIWEITFFQGWDITSTILSVELNSTWACSLAMQQSQFTDTGLWWRKLQCLFAGHQARSMGWLMLRRPEDGFLGRVFKATLGVEVAGCVISSWTSFWSVAGSEVKGWCFRNLNHQPSGSK